MLFILTSCTQQESAAPTDGLKEAAAVLDRTDASPAENYAAFLKALGAARSSLEEKAQRRELMAAVNRLERFAPGVAAMSPEFLRARVGEEMAVLRQQLDGKKSAAVPAYLSARAPQVIHLSPDEDLVLQLAGWNLDASAVSANLRLSATGPEGERPLPAGVVQAVEPTGLVLRFRAGTQTELTRADTKVTARWGGETLFELPVIETVPPRTREVELPALSKLKSAPVKLEPHANGEVGDLDLYSEDTRPGPARVQQHGWVNLGHNEREVTARLKVCFEEVTADFTRLESTTEDEVIYTLDPRGPLVSRVRAELALPEEYAAAEPVIEAIVTPTEAACSLPEYTREVATAGENGCVEKWWFYGDAWGLDRDARLEVRLKPVRVRLAFRPPEHVVGLKIPKDSGLAEGILLP